MSTLTLIGGSTPIGLAAGHDYPLEIYNNGNSGTIYVSRQPGPTPSVYDYVLAPNGRVSVPAGVGLWVCTDDNATARAYLFYHSDGAAIDPGIISAKPANSPASLSTLTLAVPNTATSNNTVGDLFPTADYASIRINHGIRPPPSASMVLDVRNFYSIYVQQTDDPNAPFSFTNENATLDRAEYALIFTSALNPHVFQVPVLRKYARVIIASNAGIIPTQTGTIKAWISGSHEVVNPYRYEACYETLVSGGIDGPPLSGVSLVAGTVGGPAVLLDSVNGPAVLGIAGTPTITAISLNVWDFGVSYRLARCTTVGLFDFILPARPIFLSYGITAGAFDATLQQ